MDMLRSCYASKMRLFPDRPEIETEGAWHWCPPGAKTVPYPSPFRASVWDWENLVWAEDALGETERQGYSKGLRDSRLTGQEPCGPEEHWRRGTPYDERGLPTDETGEPVCCNLPPLDLGPDVDGGTAEQGMVTHSACGTDGIPDKVYAHWSGPSCMNGWVQELTFFPYIEPSWVHNLEPTPCADLTDGWLHCDGFNWIFTSQCAGITRSGTFPISTQLWDGTFLVNWPAGLCFGLHAITISPDP